MSGFVGQIGSGSIGANLLQQSDDRAVQKDFQWDFGTREALEPFANGTIWSWSRFSGSDGGVSFSALVGQDGLSNLRFESDLTDVCGGAQRKKIIGTTRDASGAPLGSCIVKGYLTSTDVEVGQVTSDTGGYFELPTPYVGAAHYIVAYKAGSPDIAGTSANTLIPA